MYKRLEGAPFGVYGKIGGWMGIDGWWLEQPPPGTHHPPPPEFEAVCLCVMVYAETENARKLSENARKMSNLSTYTIHYLLTYQKFVAWLVAGSCCFRFRRLLLVIFYAHTIYTDIFLFILIFISDSRYKLNKYT